MDLNFGDFEADLIRRISESTGIPIPELTRDPSAAVGDLEEPPVRIEARDE
jgi:hypothetical protein